MLVCQYVASAQHMYAIIQENLLVWHKISKCTNPPEWNSDPRSQNELLKRNHQERTIMETKPLNPRRKRKTFWKTLIKSSEKVKWSPLNCKNTQKRNRYWLRSPVGSCKLPEGCFDQWKHQSSRKSVNYGDAVITNSLTPQMALYKMSEPPNNMRFELKGVASPFKNNSLRTWSEMEAELDGSDVSWMDTVAEYAKKG